MICPQCKAEDKKSRVWLGHTMSTSAGYSSHYDEDGHYHSHDPNRSTTSYSCSNGHRWSEDSWPVCAACGWSRKPKS